MSQLKKLVLTGTVTLLICYLAVCAFFYTVQASIIFSPSPLPPDARYSYNFFFEERFFEIDEEIKIHAIHAKTDSAAGVVIYFHGNSGNNQSDPGRYRLFLENGYDVIHPDYRGFGKSSGNLWNEDDLVGDMKAVYNAVKKEYEEHNIVLIGYSMGSGVAAQIAVGNKPGKVVLWAPYYSLINMKEVFYPFLPDALVRFPMRTDLALQQIESPVYIFYAEADEVIPIDLALPLTQYLKESDRYFILKNQKHKWMYENGELIESLSSILSKNQEQKLVND